MADLSVEDFLPAYAGINVARGDPLFGFYPDRVPDGVEKEFYPTTFLKREFNALKLPAVEPQRPPGSAFKPLNTQLFPARFLSAHTPYNKLVCVHQVGTGKTCLYSLLSETLQDQDPNMLPTLVLVRSESLETNAKSEIAYTCTQGKYVPPRWDDRQKKMISDDAFVRRLNRNLSERYIFNTWEKFAKELAANDHAYMKEVYSNRVIVIDEAHGLRIQPKETEVNIYNQIYCLLHTVQNCKIVLLTATPIWDRPREICYLANLVLPEDEWMDPETFESTYLEDGQFKPGMKAEFKRKIRGLFSYVRQMNSNIRRVYEGIVVPTYLGEPGMKKTPLVVATMESLQSKAYKAAYRLDRKNAPPIEKIEATEPEEEEPEEKADKRAGGLYKNSRQASLFVAPDGSYGTALEGKWLQLSLEQRESRENALRRKRMTPEEKEADKKAKASIKRAARLKAEKDREEEIEEEIPAKRGSKRAKPAKSAKPTRVPRSLRDKLSTSTTALKEAIWGGKEDPGNDKHGREIKLQNLARMSIKYAGVMRQLIEHPTEKAFVFCDLVAGSGVNLFAALMELFGFTHAPLPASVGASPDMEKYNSKEGNPRHFLLITSEFPTTKQALWLVNKVYNDPSNLYGDYIQVIIASEIVSEGLSFKHTRQFHNLTPWWNNTLTSQAEGRVDRTFALDVFSDPNERFIKTFRWCAMDSDSNFPSLDFEMYQVSEDKDFPIKNVERALKEAAVDCGINAARNMRPELDQDGSRACDYQSCIYQCDDIPAAWYASGTSGPNVPLIDDTYNLYYAREQIDRIKEEIKIKFRTRFMYDFFELQPLFPDAPSLVLLRSLKELIDRSTPIPNKYGIVSYLRESQNLYFLVDNHEFRSTANLYLLAEYNANPVLREELGFIDYIRLAEIQYLPEKLDALSKVAKDPNTTDVPAEIQLSLRSFDPKIQEALLEGSWRAEKRKSNQNIELRKAVLNIYDPFIVKPEGEGLVISPLLNEDYNVLRCYDEKRDEWSDCSSDKAALYSTASAKRRAKIKANPYGYYGVYRSKTNTFGIATVQEGRIAASTKKVDKRVVDKPGTTCGTGNKFGTTKLLGFLLDMGDIADAQDPPQPAPDVRPYLDEAKIEMTNRQATANNVYKLWSRVLDSAPSYNPTRLNIEEVETELEELEEKTRPDSSDRKRIADLKAQIATENKRLETERQKIERFSPDKLKRWYAMLAFGKNAKAFLCPVLQKWFASLGLLEYR